MTVTMLTSTPAPSSAIGTTTKDASVLTVALHAAEADTIRTAFGEHGAEIEEIKRVVRSIVLPKIRDALGWKDIIVSKGRVNNWRTVELKYNSLFHRDRHVFGAAPGTTASQTGERQNMSAVVYLDPARFDFIEGSSAPVANHATSHSMREMLLAAGSIIVFPSCLIHRAVALEDSKQRRTIVLFDLEDPSEPTPLRHDIVLCPWWTQKPLLHSVKSEQEVEEQMLRDLLASRPYFWRYYKRDSPCRAHWQVTSVHDAVPTTDAGGTTVPYNTSFYLIGGPAEYPSHVRVHDHRASLRYLWNLLRFHAGSDVLA